MLDFSVSANIAGHYRSRVEACASRIPTSVDHISVLHSGVVLPYRRDDNGAALVTSCGSRWSPATALTPQHWGAVSDCSHDTQGAAQEMLNWASEHTERPHFHMPAGTYLVGGPVDWSVVDQYFDQTAAGYRSTRILATSFGASKSVWTFRENNHCSMSDIFIGKFGNRAERSDPMGIYAPEASQVTMRDVYVNGLGNTGIFCTRPFNCDWERVDLSFTGFQPVHKTVDMRLDSISFVAGTNTVSISLPQFDASCVGKGILIYTGSDNSAYFRVITEVHSPTTATVDGLPFENTANNQPYSFCGPIVSIVAGSSVITAPDPLFDPMDLGRMMYIPRALDNDETLIARVVEYISPLQVRLEQPAEVTASNAALYFSAALAISGHGVSGSTPINDICINQMRVEAWRGAGVIVKNGKDIQFNNLKTHSRAYSQYSNAGQSGQSLIWSSTNRGVINGWEHEFGVPSVRERATILINGDAPGISISGLAVSGMCASDQFIRFSAASPEAANLRINAPEVRGYLTRMRLGFATAPTTAEKARIFIDGYMTALSGEEDNQLPTVVGSASALPVFTLPAGETRSFVPAVQAGQINVMNFNAPSHRFTGVVRAWMNHIDVDKLGANTTTTKDNPGTLNVFCLNGRLHIQNGTTSSMRIHTSCVG